MLIQRLQMVETFDAVWTVRSLCDADVDADARASPEKGKLWERESLLGLLEAHAPIFKLFKKGKKKRLHFFF